jgi:sugar phosphate isomerase/epimerase
VASDFETGFSSRTTKMNWSFQLYSARKVTPWDDVLAMVADAGYAAVEGFGGLYAEIEPAKLREMLDRNSLTMPTGHFALDMLENDFAGAEQIATTLGIRTMICPYLLPERRPTDEAGWRDFAGRLQVVGERCRDAGFAFAWHNHDFEFVQLPDGTIPQQAILDGAPGIGWEIDVAWVIRGGSDPLQWIERYGPRILAVHVKDIARAGEKPDEDGWEDVGHGTVDWPAIMAALKAKTPARNFIMEHDNPGDAARFARRSIASLSAFQE